MKTAHDTGTDEEKLTVFRQVRDEIKRVFDANGAGRQDAMASSRKWNPGFKASPEFRFSW